MIVTNATEITDATEWTYCGNGGKYGPFPIQQTGEWKGWPDFGKVLRYFREKAGMTTPEFAAIYGKQFSKNGESITIRQARRMENENRVPVDMNKRQFIAKLLGIPPVLFGLAVLEDVTFTPHSVIAGSFAATGHTALQKASIDVHTYQQNIRSFWLLHSTSQAQIYLQDMCSDMENLQDIEVRTSGDLLAQVRELLFSYHILLANVVRDQRNFLLSRHHANEAVRVAKAACDTDLIATSLYTRGCTYLEWGMFGTIMGGVFQVQEDKIIKAIRDFEEAMRTSGNGARGLHPQLLGFIRVHLSRAYAILHLRNGKEIPTFAIMMLDDAIENVGKEHIDDPYTRALTTGYLASFRLEGYHSARAAAFNAGGMHGDALEEISAMESLQRGKLEQDFTRSLTWLNIVKANTFVGLQQFEEATHRARSALLSSGDIRSISNFANIVDIHGRLEKSPYKQSRKVKELGDMIHEIRMQYHFHEDGDY